MTAEDEPIEGEKVDVQVCLVDDDPALLRLLSARLEDDGCQVHTFQDGSSFLRALPGLSCVVVLLDVNLPDRNGIELLAEVRAIRANLPVIIITGDTEVEHIVDAMNAGAFDYLTKPLNTTRLIVSIRNACDRQRMSTQLAELQNSTPDWSSSRPTAPWANRGLIGNSPPMQDLYREIEVVANSGVTVLIQGESGTGKELVARAIHAQGPRSSGPWIAINCSAIPESLQEAEFFGHEKGAFTGADALRKGRFELADEGTLFLDEVAELSSALQTKLLRVTQEKSFTRIGGAREIQSDFRLVAASHRDLLELVRSGDFREDLYYRLAVLELNVPPLRERREDIALLAAKFLHEIASAHWRDPDEIERITLAPQALETLMGHDWPGNVRELRNTVQRAFLFSDSNTIEAANLSPRIHLRSADLQGSAPHDGSESAAPQPSAPHGSKEPGLPSLDVETLEQLAIEEAFRVTDGNISEALELLGMSRTTLYRKRKKYGLLV